MGADIHCYVEKKVNGIWEEVPPELGPIDYYYSIGATDNEYFNRPSWNPGRNYRLFGLLAGVRSYYVKPLSKPRGLPKDLSKSVKSIWDVGECDYHTPSYYSLSELLIYKNYSIPMISFLNISEYEDYIKTKKVDDWYSCENFPSDAEIVSNEEMNRMIKLVLFLDDKLYVTEVKWDMSIAEISKSFWMHIVPAMEKLDSNPENIRLVFWFDN